MTWLTSTGFAAQHWVLSSTQSRSIGKSTRTLRGMVLMIKYGRFATSTLLLSQVSGLLPLFKALQLIRPPASLPLLRPVFRSFGGIFSGLKSSASPDENYVNIRSTHTYGSTPVTKRSRAHKANHDSDSVIEFADDGDFAEASSKAYALHTIAPRNPEAEARDGIYVKNEMKVDFNRI